MPSLVPVVQGQGLGPIQKNTDANLFHWDLPDKKSIIQLIMIVGKLHWLYNFLMSIL